MKARNRHKDRQQLKKARADTATRVQNPPKVKLVAKKTVNTAKIAAKGGR